MGRQNPAENLLAARIGMHLVALEPVLVPARLAYVAAPMRHHVEKPCRLFLRQRAQPRAIVVALGNLEIRFCILPGIDMAECAGHQQDIARMQCARLTDDLAYGFRIVFLADAAAGFLQMAQRHPGCIAQPGRRQPGIGRAARGSAMR